MKNNVYKMEKVETKEKSKNYLDKRKTVIRVCAFLGAALIFGTFCASLFL